MRLDVSDIYVRPALSDEEKEEVFNIRFEGYKKYFSNRNDVIDNFDTQKNAILLLATNSYGENLGTIRILDRRNGPIELDSFLTLGDICDDRLACSCIEATRFSVPFNKRSKDIKTALYKAYYLYCWNTKAKAGLIWAREGAAREYKWLLFESLGEKGKFKHPQLSNKLHETYILKFYHEKSWQEKHPLYKIVCLENHPNITLPLTHQLFNSDMCL